MKRRHHNNAALNLTSMGVTTGVGASVVTSVGGNASGLAAMSSFYPAMGTMAGAGMVLKKMKKL